MKKWEADSASHFSEVLLRLFNRSVPVPTSSLARAGARQVISPIHKR